MFNIISKFNFLFCELSGVNYPTSVSWFYLWGYSSLAGICLIFFIAPFICFYSGLEFSTYACCASFLFLGFLILLFALHFPKSKKDLQIAITKSYLSILILYFYFSFTFIVCFFTRNTLYYIAFLAFVYFVILYFAIKDIHIYLFTGFVIMCLKVHLSNYSLYSLGFIAVYFFMFLVFSYRNNSSSLNSENKGYFAVLKNDQMVIKNHLINDLLGVYYLDILNNINLFFNVACFLFQYSIDLSLIYSLYIIIGFPVFVYRLLIIAFFNMLVAKKLATTCIECTIKGGGLGLAYTGVAYGFPIVPIPGGQTFRVYTAGADFLSYSDLELYKKYCVDNPGQEFRAIYHKNGVPTINHKFLEEWKKGK